MEGKLKILHGKNGKKEISDRPKSCVCISHIGNDWLVGGGLVISILELWMKFL